MFTYACSKHTFHEWEFSLLLFFQIYEMPPTTECE